MSHSITIKLNRPANEFPAGESIGFGIGGGVRYWDSKLKENDYTDYKAVVFTRQPKQAQYYRDMLIEGAVVEVSAKQQKIDSYEGQNGTRLSIEFIDAWIGSINQSAPRVEKAMDSRQDMQREPQPQANKVAEPSNFDNFDDDIPF